MYQPINNQYPANNNSFLPHTATIQPGTGISSGLGYSTESNPLANNLSGGQGLGSSDYQNRFSGLTNTQQPLPYSSQPRIQPYTQQNTFNPTQQAGSTTQIGGINAGGQGIDTSRFGQQTHSLGRDNNFQSIQSIGTASGRPGDQYNTTQPQDTWRPTNQISVSNNPTQNTAGNQFTQGPSNTLNTQQYSSVFPQQTSTNAGIISGTREHQSQGASGFPTSFNTQHITAPPYQPFAHPQQHQTNQQTSNNNQQPQSTISPSPISFGNTHNLDAASRREANLNPPQGLQYPSQADVRGYTPHTGNLTVGNNYQPQTSGIPTQATQEAQRQAPSGITGGIKPTTNDLPSQYQPYSLAGGPIPTNTAQQPIRSGTTSYSAGGSIGGLFLQPDSSRLYNPQAGYTGGAHQPTSGFQYSTSVHQPPANTQNLPHNEFTSYRDTIDSGRDTASPGRSGLPSKNFGQRETALSGLQDQGRQSASDNNVSKNLFPTVSSRYSQSNLPQSTAAVHQSSSQGALYKPDNNTQNNPIFSSTQPAPDRHTHIRDIGGGGANAKTSQQQNLTSIPEEPRGQSMISSSHAQLDDRFGISPLPGYSSIQPGPRTFQDSESRSRFDNTNISRFDYTQPKVDYHQRQDGNLAPLDSRLQAIRLETQYQPQSSQDSSQSTTRFNQQSQPRDQNSETLRLHAPQNPQTAPSQPLGPGISNKPPPSTLHTQLPATSSLLDNLKPMRREVISENVMMPDGVLEGDTLVYYYVDRVVPKYVEDIIEKYIEVPTVRDVEVPFETIVEKIVNNDKVVNHEVEVVRYVEGPLVEKIEDVEIEIIKVVEKPIYVDKKVIREKEIVVEKLVEVPTEKFVEIVNEKYVDVEVDISVIKKIPRFQEKDLELTTKRKRRTSHVNENLRTSLHNSVERINRVVKENADLKAKLGVMRERSSSYTSKNNERNSFTVNKKERYEELKVQYQSLKDRMSSISNSPQRKHRQVDLSDSVRRESAPYTSYQQTVSEQESRQPNTAEFSSTPSRKYN